MFKSNFMIVVLGVIAVAIGGWYLFLRDTTPEPVLTTEDLTTSQGAADREVVETLLQLRAITLAGTILTDPAFLRLVDTGTQIVPEPVGRPNPFLPLSRSSSVGTTTPSQRTPPTDAN